MNEAVIKLSAKRFQKDGVSVSGFIGFVWTEGR